MARLIKILLVLSIGLWFSIVTLQQFAAQQPSASPSDRVWIADFGLESQIPSALDLVGPEHGSAGCNRAELLHRLQCWIDGIESCSVADPNDPRVRAFRRLLMQSLIGQYGTVIVHFPDQTHIAVLLKRIPDDWGQRGYEPVLLLDTARGQGEKTILPERSKTPAISSLNYHG